MVERAPGFSGRVFALIFGRNRPDEEASVFSMCFGFSICFSFELVQNGDDLRTHQTAVRTINAKQACERTSCRVLEKLAGTHGQFSYPENARRVWARRTTPRPPHCRSGHR